MDGQLAYIRRIETELTQLRAQVAELQETVARYEEVVRDRDEWKAQHDNLLSVRQSDLQALNSKITRYECVLTKKDVALIEAVRVVAKWGLSANLDTRKRKELDDDIKVLNEAAALTVKETK